MTRDGVAAKYDSYGDRGPINCATHVVLEGLSLGRGAGKLAKDQFLIHLRLGGSHGRGPPPHGLLKNNAGVFRHFLESPRITSSGGWCHLKSFLPFAREAKIVSLDLEYQRMP